MKNNILRLNFLIFLLFFITLNANENIDTKGDKMVVLKPTLTLKGAKSYIHAAQKIAAQKNLNLSIAVVDSSGELLAFSRMDNASLVTTDVAIQKLKQQLC